MTQPFQTPAPLHRGLSLSYPPDQPFVPDGVSKSDGLTGEQRREAQRHLTRVHQYNGEVSGMQMAIRDNRINLAMQSLWFSGGSYLIHRGFNYADHTHSFAGAWTKNTVILRLMNPVSIVGMVMAGVTLYQLPTDVKTLMSAHEWYDKAVANREREAKLFEEKMGVGIDAAPADMKAAGGTTSGINMSSLGGFDEEAKK